jgi:hypothetical protein
LAEGVKHLGLAQARGVVFEGEAPGGFVDMEAAEAVGVGEFAEPLELLVAEGSQEFVADFEKCHGGEYSSPSLRKLLPETEGIVSEMGYQKSDISEPTGAEPAG